MNKGKIKGGGGGRVKGDAYHHVVTELIIDFFYWFYPFLFFVPWHCSTPSLSAFFRFRNAIPSVSVPSSRESASQRWVQASREFEH